MSLLNLWSLGHFVGWGLMGRFVLTNWYAFLLLSIGWELLELRLPYEFAVESSFNKISDLVVNTIGFYLGLTLRDDK